MDHFLLEHGTGRILLNEANNIPGFRPRSMYPRTWAASGLRLPGLVDALVADAVARRFRRRSRRVR